MRSRPPISTRLASLSLAALGLILPSRANAASSTYGVTDLGAGVSGLVLGESGQVAGLRADPGGSDYLGPNNYATPFEYDPGRFTTLAAGVVPIAVANDGRVINSRGPYDFAVGPYYYSSAFFVEPLASAGNHLGELVGTATRLPFATGDEKDPTYYLAEERTPYIYIPNKPGAVSIPDQLRYYYEAGYNVGPDAGFGVAKPGIMYTGSGAGKYPYSGPHPTGVNDHGLIIGDIYSSDARFSGDIFQPLAPKPNPSYIHAASGSHDLGTLGGLNSHAAAVNNSGLVVGSADTAGGASHAFLFTPSDPLHPGIGRMIDLGTLPGMMASAALGINDRGQVVGWSSVAALSSAFLLSNGIMEDLNDRLPATMGIHLDRAIAINDAGQIVAYGHGADGVEHGYLLPATPTPTPTPEPTALAVLVVAGAGLGVRRLGFSKKV